MDSGGSGQGSMASSYEHGDKPPGSSATELVTWISYSCEDCGTQR
jgi:hypothetical protein